MMTGRSLSDSSIPLENIFRKTGLLEARTAVLTGTFCVEDAGPAKDGSKNSKAAQTLFELSARKQVSLSKLSLSTSFITCLSRPEIGQTKKLSVPQNIPELLTCRRHQKGSIMKMKKRILLYLSQKRYWWRSM
jgi:hypothetical protein